MVRLLLEFFVSSMLVLSALTSCSAFSAVDPEVSNPKVDSASGLNNVLILDHLNINHEKGRHDWLTAFYVDFLQCALDPRKMENVVSGEKTIWANIGANQFHLPEGKPDAQVLDGSITLVYEDLSKVMERSEVARSKLEGSKFEVQSVDDDAIVVVDPWGTTFKLAGGDPTQDGDSRGQQPGDASEGLAMRDLTIHIPPGSNLQGIGRFYAQVLGASVKIADGAEPTVQIEVGPGQSLTFTTNPSTAVESHVDLRDETVEIAEGGNQAFLSNYGPHVSMYARDFPSTYKRADALGLVYVNPRFKRRAYTLDEAIDDCMFRCLDIVDPENLEDGPIVKLEHEIRSVVKRNGSMYKSCPFDEIPSGCTNG